MIARLTPAALREQLAAGGVALDVREPPAYADAHLRGALNVALSNRSAPYWVNTLIPAERAIAVITATDRDGAFAEQLLAVSERRAAGFLPFDAAGFGAAGLPVTSIRTLIPPDLAAERDRLTVLDVREQQEWTMGHVPGAVWIPLAELAQRLDEVPPGPVAAICASGFRSSTAASILESAGRDELANVWGGTTAWRQMGFPTNRGREP